MEEKEEKKSYKKMFDSTLRNFTLFFFGFHRLPKKLADCSAPFNVSFVFCLVFVAISFVAFFVSPHAPCALVDTESAT